MAYELLLDEPKKKKYELVEDKPELLGKKISRGVIGTGLRAYETLLGIPGNTLSTGLGAASYLTGGRIPSYEDIQQKLPVSFPTTPQLRQKTREITGEEFEPKSKLGEKYDSAVETFTSLASPDVFGKGLKFGKAVKGALGGEVASSLVKELGGGETAQSVAKVAGVLGGSMGFNNRELKGRYQQNYDKTKKVLAGQKIPAETLEEGIPDLYKKWVEADSPAGEFAAKRLKALDGIIQEGKVDAGDLWKLKKQAGQWYDGANKYEKWFLDDLVNLEKESLKGVGPDYKVLQEADDIYSSFMQGNKASRFIEKNLPAAVKLSPIVKGLFGLGVAKTGYLPWAATIYGGAKLTGKAKMAYNFWKTETGKNYYNKIVKDSLAGNSLTLSRDIAKMNEAALEFEKNKGKVKYELLD